MRERVAAAGVRAMALLAPIVLIVFAVLPTDSLEVVLGVPLRLAGGTLAAAIFDACGRGGNFDSFVLRASEITPLLVVPECAGGGKFLLLLAVATFLATNRRLTTRRTCALLAMAAVLAIGGNAWRLVGVAGWVPTIASRSGVHSLVHEMLGLLPLGVAILVLAGLARSDGQQTHAAWRSVCVTFPLGIAVAALALFPLGWRGDLEGPSLRDRLERSGLSTRVVDARVDAQDRPYFTVEVFGAGRTVVELERYETIDGLRSWPDLYAVRFARLTERRLGPIRRVCSLDS